ncbi:N-acyl homoserine lactonase [Xenorhabdus sp. IM139775]|uniref:N-acyl homoserine lactonase n=1 Tax=Xenorhabdus sp. IM139775 TaxID=3025876 RepID=UPI002358414F|nr:N-acyl homoserine lactonase [Xenorhabdus sp. IM139775]MDC9594872.1 N-acyl homoserine lactonase [Xenorhabdus sp. IM139775]
MKTFMNKISFTLKIIMCILFFIGNANSDTGDNIIKKLTQRYFDNQINCGDDGLPVFLCSGILIRGTVASDAYHSWNPSPGAQRLGGVSFSYLRSDIKSIELASEHHNGYIFSPYIEHLENLDNTEKINIEILCYYPVDGNTQGRLDKGCGSSTGYPNLGSCQQQNITTTQQWIDKYGAYPDNNEICGFDVTGDGSASIFMQGLKVNSILNFSSNNELIIAVWEQNIPNTLPIEAFFYQNEGLQDAQHDQKDFYQSTGTVIPIVKIIFPSSSDEKITFTYNEEDQLKFN